MKNLLILITFSIISTGLFSQDIPIPKKEKLLAEFGNQLVTFSKKTKSVNIHFKNEGGAIETHQIDFSETKGLSKLMKRFQNPVIGGINTPESALEKFKIYKQGSFIYVTLESISNGKHSTDVSVFDTKTDQFKRETLFSTPADLQGVSYKIKGTSCILDETLFQTFYNGFHYGIVIYDLKSFEKKKMYSVQIPNKIDFKNSGIVYTRDVKGFNLFKKDKKKRVSDVAFYQRLNTDLPFVCVSKDEENFALTLGCYNLKEYENWYHSNPYNNLGQFVGGGGMWSSKSSTKNSIVFFSTLNADSLEHIPND